MVSLKLMAQGMGFAGADQEGVYGVVGRHRQSGGET